jgi:Mpv17 / PMP22 family
MTALTLTTASRSVSSMSHGRLAVATVGTLTRSGPVQRFASSSSSRTTFRRFDTHCLNNHRRRLSTSYTYTSSSYSSSSSKSSSSSSSWSSFFGWYSNKLDTHPITTKCVSAGLISALGNVLAQAIAHYQEQMEQDEKDEQECHRRRREQQHEFSMGHTTTNTNYSKTSYESSASSSPPPRRPFEVDLAQVSRFAFLNVVFVAPVLHHWYQFINRTVPGKSLSRVAQRVFWDEFVFSPMYIPVFLGMLWKLEGSSNDDIIKMTKSEVPAIIVAEWALWVPAMFATFRFVPVKFQVLVINTIGVVWQTFLAYMASHAKNKANDVVEQVNMAEQKAVAKAHHVLDVVSHRELTDSKLVENKKGTSQTGDTKEQPLHDPIVHGIPAGVVVEEKVVPLVLNTIVRKETPRYYEIDMSDEYDD